MNSKKILCVIDDLGSGGAQRQLVNIALGLKERGHTIQFVTYFKKTFYYQLLTENEVKITQIDEQNPIKRLFKFRKFIRSNQFDIVISFLGVPSLLASFAAFPSKKFKLLVGERSCNPAMKNSLKSRLLRFFYFKADYIVANSHANINMVKYMLPWINKEKYKVIYNVIDLEIYKPINNFEFRQNNKFKIVIPASYRRLKNLLGLIEAVNLLTDDQKSVLQIDWYGDKNKKNQPDSILQEAEALISKYQLESVINLNDVTHQINEKLSGADAVGLFSFFEGLPNAVCEGMASGKPIVATSVSDVPQLVINNQNGFLCQANDIKSISNSLKQLLELTNTELTQMGIVSRNEAENLFEKAKIINQYESLFK